ncbi:hypothetical protein IHE44_0009073 [Lamprotornis superbus]|uniref:Uncharacterized protein n=1 Tax=Lamprotornis superbus TaxID=245042 RepID=A0A835NYA8_9PASS|nr:hypothetical protein IHE44_0009073 [Lamprotornis superbus]
MRANQSLNEIQPFQLKISYPPSDEDSDDSEEENQELAQIDRERRRNCTLTPLATNQLQNQENQCCKVRALFHASLDRHSSEEELERINREFAAEKRKWSQVSRLTCCSDGNNTSSSDEEVKNLCAMSFRPVAEQGDGLHASPSPVLFSASPPKRLQPLVCSPASRPLILTGVGAGLEQVMPCKRHRQGYGDKVSRPSLDLEKMQQDLVWPETEVWKCQKFALSLQSLGNGAGCPVQFPSGASLSKGLAVELVISCLFIIFFPICTAVILQDGPTKRKLKERTMHLFSKISKTKKALINCLGSVWHPVFLSQKMLLKKNCGAKTRVIKIRSINGGRPPPHFVYDPSTFAFRSLSTLKPLSPIAPLLWQEEANGLAAVPVLIPLMDLSSGKKSEFCLSGQSKPVRSTSCKNCHQGSVKHEDGGKSSTHLQSSQHQREDLGGNCVLMDLLSAEAVCVLGLAVKFRYTLLVSVGQYSQMKQGVGKSNQFRGCWWKKLERSLSEDPWRKSKGCRLGDLNPHPTLFSLTRVIQAGRAAGQGGEGMSVLMLSQLCLLFGSRLLQLGHPLHQHHLQEKFCLSCFDGTPQLFNCCQTKLTSAGQEALLLWTKSLCSGDGTAIAWYPSKRHIPCASGWDGSPCSLRLCSSRAAKVLGPKEEKIKNKNKKPHNEIKCNSCYIHTSGASRAFAIFWVFVGRAQPEASAHPPLGPQMLFKTMVVAMTPQTLIICRPLPEARVQLVKGRKLAHSLALHSQPPDQGKLGVELLLPLCCCLGSQHVFGFSAIVPTHHLSLQAECLGLQQNRAVFVVKHGNKLQCGNSSDAQGRQIKGINEDLTGYFSAVVTNVTDKGERGCWPPLDARTWHVGRVSQSPLQEIRAEIRETRAELWSLSHSPCCSYCPVLLPLASISAELFTSVASKPVCANTSSSARAGRAAG